MTNNELLLAIAKHARAAGNDRLADLIEIGAPVSMVVDYIYHPEGDDDTLYVLAPDGVSLDALEFNVEMTDHMELS